jgi:hypothetical protein
LGDFNRHSHRPQHSVFLLSGHAAASGSISDGSLFLHFRQQPEIVGQVDNASLEAIRRLGWRALDRVCDLIMVIRLSMAESMDQNRSQPPISNARPITRGW